MVKGRKMVKSLRKFVFEYRELSLVVIAMTVGLVLDLAGLDTYAHWLLGFSALAAVIPLLWNMLKTLRSGQYGVDILAATAIITSVIMQEYWAGMVIVLMLTGGEALEDYAERRAKIELSNLLERKPRQAHILKGRKSIDVAVSVVNKNDKILIYPGEVVPVDCVIIEGGSDFDESSLTGEPLPVPKKEGDQLLSGSVNTEGAVTAKALRPASESQYEQIIKLVESAAASRAPFVRLADRYSIPFTIISFTIAGGAWILSGQAIRFLEVLVVATPCPLLLGAPIALISGMSRAAKHGIIVKTGSSLEKLAATQTIAFDKTGTLTKGEPTVAAIRTYNKFSSDDVLQYAASLEQRSTHILAQAIVAAAKARGLRIRKVKQTKEVSGYGLSGTVDGKIARVGRISMLNQAGIVLPKGFKPNSLQRMSTFVAVDNQVAGIIQFKDEIRPESKLMLQQLGELGVSHTLMITGDSMPSAQAVAKELGIEQVHADALPADKMHSIEHVANRPVAFVGDGVNDAPVLTTADIGIALGARGSTAASESADVVIMLDDIGRVATAISIAKRTLFIAKQSVLIGIFISIGLMFIFSTGRFKPVYGAAIQELVDVTVIINALRAHGSKRSRS